MLDPKLIKNRPEYVKEGVKKKGYDPGIVDLLLRLIQERNEVQKQLDNIKMRKKDISREIEPLLKLMRADKSYAKEPERIPEVYFDRMPFGLAQALDLSEEARGLKEKERVLLAKFKELDKKIKQVLAEIPNLPHPSVPEGKGPEDNVVAKTWGELPRFAFEPKPHWEIAERLGIIDFKRGAKIAGSGFPVFVGDGARLVRALENFFLDYHVQRGFVEVRPPLLVRPEAAFGTGQLPDKEGLMYEVAGGYYLIPTSEVPVTNLHAGEILDASELPKKYTSYTPNFRVEAGSYGKDVRGLNRLHQFDKVEMVVISHPSESYDWLERLTRQAEEILELLELPYRRLLMCTGDMGFTQAKKYDLEVYSAGQDKWLEVSSISNMEDYQARRMNLRFREKGKKPEFAHTLNGSGLAFPRVIAALLENHQQADGSVRLPEALVPYFGKEKID